MNKNRPYIVHPTIPGAVGSINSPYLEGRDKEAEARLIIEDIAKLLQGNQEPHNDLEKKDINGGKTRGGK